ncbi:MAG: hypothetical protein PHC75_01030 [Burkholderiales bacterium]|nr:hypothetical protein [Burkholderiales bacterium]
MKYNVFLLSILCVISNNIFATELSSSESGTISNKKLHSVQYNLAESHDFYIDQCARDENGICIPISYHEQYISPNHYPQNPYGYMISGGGTRVLTESDNAKSNWSKFFTNGTYNVFTGAASGMLNPYNINYAYGGNVFMQSGHVNNFSVGGAFEVINPFLQPDKRYLTGDISYYMLPNSQVVTPSQLFVEYQIPDTFQVDAGWIFIQTPWMNSYDDAMLVTAPYQGVLANYQLSNNWRLTGVASNGYEIFGNTSFGGDTYYNDKYGNFRSPYNGSSPITGNMSTNGSYALGAVYHPSEDYKLNLWAYTFENYANTIYGDSEYEFHVNPVNKFNVGVQIGNQNTIGLGSHTIPYVAGDGSVNSYLYGAKIGYSFDDWLNAEISYDSMFGPNNSFYGGGFVSPYSFTVVNDPLYTSGLGAGMIEQGGGNSYRGALTFKPFPSDSKSKIEIAYEQFNTINPLQEYDFDFKWVPNSGPRGLIVHFEGDYALAPKTNSMDGGSFIYMETMLSYTY